MRDTEVRPTRRALHEVTLAIHEAEKLHGAAVFMFQRCTCGGLRAWAALDCADPCEPYHSLALRIGADFVFVLDKP